MVSLAGAVFLPRVCSVSVLAYPLAMSWALIICTKYEINSEKYEILKKTKKKQLPGLKASEGNKKLHGHFLKVSEKLKKQPSI